MTNSLFCFQPSQRNLNSSRRNHEWRLVAQNEDYKKEFPRFTSDSFPPENVLFYSLCFIHEFFLRGFMIEKLFLFSWFFFVATEFHTWREKVEFLSISVTFHCFNSCVLSLRQRKNIFVLKIKKQKIIFIIIFLGGNSFFSVSEIK